MWNKRVIEPLISTDNAQNTNVTLGSPTLPGKEKGQNKRNLDQCDAAGRIPWPARNDLNRRFQARTNLKDL